MFGAACGRTERQARFITCYSSSHHTSPICRAAVVYRAVVQCGRCLLRWRPHRAPGLYATGSRRTRAVAFRARSGALQDQGGRAGVKDG